MGWGIEERLGLSILLFELWMSGCFCEWCMKWCTCECSWCVCGNIGAMLCCKFYFGDGGVLLVYGGAVCNHAYIGASRMELATIQYWCAYKEMRLQRECSQGTHLYMCMNLYIISVVCFCLCLSLYLGISVNHLKTAGKGLFKYIGTAQLVKIGWYWFK